MNGIATRKKVGTVISVRISPKDSMAVYDALIAVGLKPADFTFPSAVSRFITNAVETFCTSGIIPRRDGFEYSDIMTSFKDGTTSYKGQAVASAHIPSMVTAPDPIKENDAMQASVDPNIKFRRLMAKKTSCPDEWTPADEDDLQETMNAALGISKGS